MSDLDFNPLDQEFLPRDMVRQETVKMLAGLELQKHNLRMQAVLGGSGEIQTQQGQTINQTLNNLERAMIALKSKFADVLMPVEDAGTQ